MQESSRGCGSSKDTMQLITELQQQLPEDASPVKLYAQNFDVDKCNSECLLEMEGMFLCKLSLWRNYNIFMKYSNLSTISLQL